VADPREDEPDSSGPESSDRLLLPPWHRLIHELNERVGLTLAGIDKPPIMIDRFEVRRLVGMGGMGCVLEGFDPKLRRRVAIKICKTPSVDAVKYIEHEAHCLARLSHPNIVAVFEVVRFGDDVALVMEYVEGQTLHAWRVATKPTWREILGYCGDAGRALAALHAKGLEHGDFKPDNVMIDGEGRVRVVDFGVARYSIASSGVNEAGEIEIKGTRAYLAPERQVGKLHRVPGKPVSPQADIYAFCVSTWELLDGVRPYSGKTVVALVESMVIGKPEIGMVGSVVVPDAVRGVLERGLRARASERPQSMDELLRDLADACETASSRRARGWKRVGVGLGVALVVVASVGMTAMLIELSVVEQTLALARTEARDGDSQSAVEYLELARKRALRDGDLEAQRTVADAAEQLGHLALERGDRKAAGGSWGVAYDAFFDLRDEDSIERIAKLLAAVAEPSANRSDHRSK